MNTPCGCFCRVNHPHRMGICTVEALVTVKTAGGVDVSMCPACAAVWGKPLSRGTVKVKVWSGVTVSRQRQYP